MTDICDEVEPWSSPEGEAFVSVRVDGHIEHYPVAGRAFKDWLRCQLATRYSQGGRPASANENAIKEACHAVEARARFHGGIYPAPIRITEHHGGIYIDLGSEDWSAIHVSEEGWSQIAAAPVPILRGKKSAPFANPSIADFGPLRDLLGHLDNDTYILLIAWCLGAMLPDGPYPILILGGEQGSGKSTLARLLQRIVDPVHGDLLQPPGNDRDLIAAAKNRRVLAFDNLSDIGSEVADSLCRLATGSEIGGRALYTDHDTASFSACRPLIINGISDLASRGDLEDRAIVLRLPLLPVRATEKDWKEKVEAVLPQTFAALLDALSHGMGMLSATATPHLRMADFARFIVAAETRLPWANGDFVAAYKRSQLNAKAILIENDPVAAAVSSFMNQQPTAWEGSVSELYSELTKREKTAGSPESKLPRSPHWFSSGLRRAAPALRAHGIDCQQSRTSQCSRVKISKIATFATSASSASSAAANDAEPANDASDANVAIQTLFASTQYWNGTQWRPQGERRYPKISSEFRQKRRSITWGD